MYEYAAKVVSVHDGDTATFQIDLGFRIYSQSALRFYGINAPELSTPEGKLSRDFLHTLLPEGTAVILKTTRNQFDKYGRYLASVYTGGGLICVNTVMVETSHALAWDGTGTKPV